MKNIQYICEILLKTILLSLFIMVFSYSFGLYNIYGYLLIVLILLIITLWILIFIDNALLDKYKILVTVLLILYVGFNIKAYLFNTIDDFTDFLTFVALILIIYISYRSSLDIIKFKILKFAYILFPFLLLLKLFTLNTNIFDGALRFGFENQNSFAIYILIIFMLNYLFYKKGKGLTSVLSLFSLILCSFYIYLSGSRTSFLSMLFFVFLNLYPLKKKTLKILFTFSMWFPVIFPIIYIGLWYIIGDPSFTILNREIFTNRQLLWIEATKNIQAFGVPHYDNMNSFLFSNSGGHNIYLSFIWGYSIFTFIIFLIYFNYFVYKRIKYNFMISDKIPVIAFTILMIHGSFEDTLFRNLWVMTFGFIFIMIRTNKNVLKKSICKIERSEIIE